MRRLLIMIAMGALVIGALVPAAVAAPADGNGNKEVMELDFSDIPIFCDEDDVPDLSLDVSGFIQFKEFKGNGNKNLELTVFHIDEVYSNADGDTWVWRDRGPDHLYVDDNGDLIVTITGRAGVNNVGHVVLNLTTGEIELQAGMSPFGGELFENGPVDFACETLFG